MIAFLPSMKDMRIIEIKNSLIAKWNATKFLIIQQILNNHIF